MKLYPEKFDEKIGFDKIKQLLLENCMSPMGQSYVDKIRFSSNFDVVKKLLGQAAEFRIILQLGLAFPSQNYLDPSPWFKRVEPLGSYLDEEQFFDLKLSLQTIQDVFDFFRKREDAEFPLLREIVFGNGDRDWKNLLLSINKVLDERGVVKDHASPELLSLRKSLASEQNKVRRSLEKIFKTALNSGWISTEMSLTVRNGRLVIPVFAEHKRKLRGFVHDETASGKIAFVEPGEVLEANNEIRDLEIRERREVIRILENLTNELRPYISSLRQDYKMLGLVDFIRSKAKVAGLFHATAPLLVEEPLIEWYNAIHPILYLTHQKQNKKVVPLQLKLDKNNRILVVSGPNAGGKSVLLKTVGLIQYMAQCGLLVPLPPDAKLGIFEEIFVDIGDEQSIENDLSTYSSHLTNMRFFLHNAGKKTLFLIDEFGTGTEPNIGGAIAESILEDLLKSKAIGIVNTHYTNLKLYADSQENLVNGAMKFDAERLEPLYALEMGKPGSSFALEVAKKIGLPQNVIQRAKQKAGTQQVDFEKMIRELEIEKQVFVERNQELLRQNNLVAQKIHQSTGLKEFLDNEKKGILNKAKAEAKDLLKEANKTIEDTIKQIKEKEAKKEETKALRDGLQKLANEKLKPESIQAIATKESMPTEGGPIVVGSYVRIKDTESIGQVIGIKGKDFEIAMGALKSKVKGNRLEKVNKAAWKKATSPAYSPRKSGVDLNEKVESFSFNIDLRGKRAEEAIPELDRIMNDAILLGYPELRIVHGKGDGVLRNIVRTHLKNYKEVSHMEDEHADRGGYGVTLVSMR